MKPSDAVRCSVQRALGDVGERWSLLIVREALMGSSRFDEFHERLGVARNILTDRLTTLVEAGVMARTPSAGNARIPHYRLTQKGKELLPVLVALMQWGDRWLHADIGPPVVLVDRQDGLPVQPVSLLSQDGRPLAAAEVSMTAGPGATTAMRERLGKRPAKT